MNLLVPLTALYKRDVVALACNYSTLGVERGGSEVQGHLWMNGEFKTSQPGLHETFEK